MVKRAATRSLIGLACMLGGAGGCEALVGDGTRVYEAPGDADAAASATPAAPDAGEEDTWSAADVGTTTALDANTPPDAESAPVDAYGGGGDGNAADSAGDSTACAASCIDAAGACASSCVSTWKTCVAQCKKNDEMCRKRCDGDKVQCTDGCAATCLACAQPAHCASTDPCAAAVGQ